LLSELSAILFIASATFPKSPPGPTVIRVPAATLACALVLNNALATMGEADIVRNVRLVGMVIKPCLKCLYAFILA
jgi:hypothetical protein